MWNKITLEKSCIALFKISQWKLLDSKCREGDKLSLSRAEYNETELHWVRNNVVSIDVMPLSQVWRKYVLKQCYTTPQHVGWIYMTISDETILLLQSLKIKAKGKNVHKESLFQKEWTGTKTVRRYFNIKLS